MIQTADRGANSRTVEEEPRQLEPIDLSNENCSSCHYSQFVYLSVWTPTPLKPLEGSSQYFQGLIRVSQYPLGGYGCVLFVCFQWVWFSDNAYNLSQKLEIFINTMFL